MEKVINEIYRTASRTISVLFFFVTVFYVLGGVLGTMGFSGFLSDASHSDAAMRGLIDFLFALVALSAGLSLWFYKKILSVIMVAIFIYLVFYLGADFLFVYFSYLSGQGHGVFMGKTF